MPGLLKPSDIVEEVRQVLLSAHQGKGTALTFLTAYQILDRLPEDIRARLIGERTEGGADAGTTFAAPSVVSRAARMAGAQVEYMDSIGVSIQVAGQSLVPSYEVCGLYRLSQVDLDVA
jgi:hypothetical protein